MKKILLPTDFSDNAWNAICYALEFFSNEKCEFQILHTYTPTFYRIDYLLGGPSFSAIPDAGVDTAQKGLDKTLVDIHLNYKNPKHKFKVFSAFNTLTNEVSEHTQTKNIDFIVMGTQGATGAKEIFLGTHTVHVLRKSQVPVLVVPVGSLFQELKTIAFATDYETPFKNQDLYPLKYVRRLHKAILTIINIKEENDLTDNQITNRASLMAYFRDQNPILKQVKDKLMPNAILEYIHEHQIELLAMMNRKHSFLNRLMIKPNVESIGYHTKVPFLVIPDTWKEQKINSR